MKLFARKVEPAIPDRLWRRIVAAHGGDQELASVALATAILVAAENIAEPHQPKPPPPPPPPPWCPTCGHRHERIASNAPQAPADELPEAPPGSYVVHETVAEMPVPDPWRGAWD